MQGFGTLILATLAAAVAAKYCAFFYNSHVDTSLYEGIPTSNAIWYCENDIGGKMASDESNLSNSATNPDFRCGICRGARSGTKDYDIPDKIGNYAVRCGYYAKGKCSA
ncbi:hypothetical protein CGCS363_v009125 [Colletotrichum siamense]|uniref:uncharacterized protein n=1 Tax=Colletotrichum siamense TaxID=690259 RepID=UPI001872B7E3|nr:uncharacterized protein CGCS363_v009125 [Colletotrichum siamense]KAF5495366.1 hypothetical protein CGCS363_v009125 [Colletotrichum siamense]